METTSSMWKDLHFERSYQACYVSTDIQYAKVYQENVTERARFSEILKSQNPDG